MRGALTLVFDDGYTEVYDDVLPLLRKYRFPAVFAVPVSSEAMENEQRAKQRDVGFTPLHIWKEACAKDGHELAAHGVHHAPLPALGDAALERELRACKEATGATTLVYPGGAFDERVKVATAKHFRAARTVSWGMERRAPRDAYELRTYNATRRNFRLWTWNLRARLAALSGRWSIETFHRVTDDLRPNHAVSFNELEAHLAFLATLPLKIVTIRDVLS